MSRGLDQTASGGASGLSQSVILWLCRAGWAEGTACEAVVAVEVMGKGVSLAGGSWLVVYGDLCSENCLHGVAQSNTGTSHLCFGLSPALVQDTGSMHAQSHHHLWGPAQRQSRPGTPPPHPLGCPPSRAAGLAPHLPGRLGAHLGGHRRAGRRRARSWGPCLRESHHRQGVGSHGGFLVSFCLR